MCTRVLQQNSVSKNLCMKSKYVQQITHTPTKVDCIYIADAILHETFKFNNKQQLVTVSIREKHQKVTKKEVSFVVIRS